MTRPIKALTTMAMLALIALVVAGCGSSSTKSTANVTAPTTAKATNVVISHATKGCHDWSVNGNKPAAKQSISLPDGGSLNVVNNDVMPHTLVQTKGSAATLSAAKLTKPGATTVVKFPNAGTYYLSTKAGEDYPSAAGLKTVGADHTLQMKVVVG